MIMGKFRVNNHVRGNPKYTHVSDIMCKPHTLSKKTELIQRASVGYAPECDQCGFYHRGIQALKSPWFADFGRELDVQHMSAK